MKYGIVPAISTLFLTASLWAQSRPIPAGVREADQVEAKTQKNLPPPIRPRRSIDPEKLQRDANELAALAATIPPDVNQTAKGVLPKDLSRKLKRIEKLAKQLRGELNP